jgi:hypothetical protein
MNEENEKKAVMDSLKKSGNEKIEKHEQLKNVNQVLGISAQPVNIEIAKAEGIRALKESDYEKIKVLTDLEEKAVPVLTALDTFGKHLEANGVHTVIPNTIESYITYRISYKRKSREEIVEVVKNEGEGGGKLNAIDRVRRALFQ